MDGRPRSTPSGSSRPGLSSFSAAPSGGGGGASGSTTAFAASSLSLSAADRALVDAARQRRAQGQAQQQGGGHAVAAARVREQQHAARVARAGADKTLHEALWSLGLSPTDVPPLFSAGGLGEGIIGGGGGSAQARPRTSHAAYSGSRATTAAAGGASARPASSSPSRGALPDQRARSAIFEGHSQAWGDHIAGGSSKHAAEQKEWSGLGFGHPHPHQHHFGLSTVPRVPSPRSAAMRALDGGGNSSTSVSPGSTSPYLSARRGGGGASPVLGATMTPSSSTSAAQAVAALRIRLDGTIRSCGGSVRPRHSVGFADSSTSFTPESLSSEAVEVPLDRHAGLVRGALEVVGGLGAALGGHEGETLARRAAAILAQASFAPPSAVQQSSARFGGAAASGTPTAAGGGGGHKAKTSESSQQFTTTYRQAAHELQQRTLDAEKMLHGKLTDGDGALLPGSSSSASSSSSSQPAISLSRFYRQLDLLSASFAGADRDALQDRLSDLRQDLFQASVAEKAWNAERNALQTQVAQLESTAREREAALEKASLALAAAKASAAQSSASPVTAAQQQAAQYASLRPPALEDHPDFRSALSRAAQATQRAEQLQSQLAMSSRIAAAQSKRAANFATLELKHLERQKVLETRLEGLEKELEAKLRPLTPRPEWERFPIIDLASTSGQQKRQARELDALLSDQEQQNQLQQQQQQQQPSNGDDRASSSRSDSPVKFTRELAVRSSAAGGDAQESSAAVGAGSVGDQMQARTAEALAAVAGDLSAAAAAGAAAPSSALAPLSPPPSKPLALRRSGPVVLSAPAVPSASAAALFASGNPVPGELVQAILPLGMDRLLHLPVTSLPDAVREAQLDDKPTSTNFFPPPPGREGLSFIKPFNSPSDPTASTGSSSSSHPSSLEHSTSSRLWSLYLAYKDCLASRSALQARSLRVVRSLQAELRDAREKLRLCEAFVTQDVLTSASKAGALAAKLVSSDGHTPLTLISLEQDVPASASAAAAVASTAAGAAMPKFFAGLGQGPDVPAYLRATGQVRNKMLSKKDMDALVRGLMNARADNLREAALTASAQISSSNSSGGGKGSATPSNNKPDSKAAANNNGMTHLSDFLYTYLKRRLGSMQALIAEVGYSFLCALEKHRARDVQAAIVLAILRGEVHENVWQDSLVMQESLRAMLLRLDQTCHQHQQQQHGHGQRTNLVPKMLLLYSLRAFFPTLTRAQLLTLARALNAEQPGQMVNVAKLLPPVEATANMVVAPPSIAATTTTAPGQDGLLGTEGTVVEPSSHSAGDGAMSARKPTSSSAAAATAATAAAVAASNASSFPFLEHLRQEHLREVLDLRRELQERCTKRAEQDELARTCAREAEEEAAAAAGARTGGAGATAASSSSVPWLKSELTVSLADVRDVWLQLDPDRPLADIEAAVAVALDLPASLAALGNGNDNNNASAASATLPTAPLIVWSHRVSVTSFFRRLLGKVYLRKVRFFDPLAKPHLGIAQQQMIIQAMNKAAAKAAASAAAAAAGSSGASSPMRRSSLPYGMGLSAFVSSQGAAAAAQSQNQALVLTGPRGQCLADLEPLDLLADAADAWMVPSGGDCVPAGHLRLQAAITSTTMAGNNSHQQHQQQWSVLMRGNSLLEPPLPPSSSDDVAAVIAALSVDTSAGGGTGGGERSGWSSAMPTRPPSATVSRRTSTNASPMFGARRLVLPNHHAASASNNSTTTSPRPNSSPLAGSSLSSGRASFQPHPPSARRA